LKSLLKLFWNAAIGVIAHLDARVLRVIVKAFQQAQGLGWGALTIQAEAKYAAEFLKQSRAKSPLIFDVGANLGTWSIELHHLVPAAEIVAFEPSNTTCKSLQNNTRDINQIEVQQLGFSDFIGTTTLYSDVPESGFASLSKRRLDHFGIALDVEEVVDITTLDKFTEELGRYPDLIKLDVEGHEMSVLVGGERTIENVRVVQFEFGGCNLDTKSSFQDFWYWFTQRGFDVYRLTPSGVKKLGQYSEADEIYQTTNYFAVRTTS
jgi:FkbM family methyltransferase